MKRRISCQLKGCTEEHYAQHYYWPKKLYRKGFTFDFNKMIKTNENLGGDTNSFFIALLALKINEIIEALNYMPICPCHCHLKLHTVIKKPSIDLCGGQRNCDHCK